MSARKDLHFYPIAYSWLDEAGEKQTFGTVGIGLTAEAALARFTSQHPHVTDVRIIKESEVVKI